jgi:hypothetical protein
MFLLHSYLARFQIAHLPHRKGRTLAETLFGYSLQAARGLAASLQVIRCKHPKVWIAMWFYGHPDRSGNSKDEFVKSRLFAIGLLSQPAIELIRNSEAENCESNQEASR